MAGSAYALRPRMSNHPGPLWTRAVANGTHASLHGVFPGRDILCNDEMYVNYFQPPLMFQSSLSRSTVNISALPQPTWPCGPSPHLEASLCHLSTAPCRQKSSAGPADHWPSYLLLKALCCPIQNQELKEDL